MLYLFATLLGITRGGLGVIVTALIGNVFGIRRVGAIMGVLAAGWALGAAIGPAMGGFIFDVSGSYAIAFAAGAAGMLLASILVALVKTETDTNPLRAKGTYRA